MSERAEARCLVVDGGASMRCALLGDLLAASAVKNGWAGIIVNGCIPDRDVSRGSQDISKMTLGVKALATHPLKSSKRDPGMRDVTVSFGSVLFEPGSWVYADADGILVSANKLSL
ncbi:ribonuclease activity regulator [Haematococcus lacustris]